MEGGGFEAISFHGAIKEVRSYRMQCGDLEARLTLTLRPLDRGNENAVARLSTMQQEEREVKVEVNIE